jgi:hypothetical protein
MPSQLTSEIYQMASKTKVVTAPKQTMVQFAVSETVNVERPYNGVDWEAGFAYASSGKTFDESIILGFFIGKPAPTADEYKAEHKKAHPKEPVPTKRNGHSAVIQKLGKAEKIQTAIENGFKPLEAWNADAHKSKRTRLGNMTMDGIFKLAKPFLGDDSEPESDDVIAFKKAKAFRTALLECKGKKYQTAFAKLEALAIGLGWVFEAEAEAETTEE